MNTITTSVVILCFAAIAYALPGSRIVGGHDAPAGKYAHMVSLRRNGVHICGGSIMNKRYILTAAHCLIGLRPKDLTIHAGTYLTNETGSVYTPEKLIHHPDYDSNTFVHDIGLIRLNEVIRFEYRKIYPIVMTNSGVVYKTGDSAFLSGWGRLTVNGEYPNHLQEIELRLVSTDQCRKYHPNVQRTQYCTLTKRGEGACYADSGSALVDRNGLQFGIVSYGNPCGIGTPDVFTSVLSYKYWIVSQLEPLL